jgi:hypothetical protein
MMSEQEGLLTRWSRRKSQTREDNAREDELLEGKPNIPIDETNQKAKLQESVAETSEVLTDADMPDIESLHEDSDFSLFMSPGVSDKLRNLALRKMFSAPVFNLRDGLDEYDEDYTSFEPLGDVITSDMKHQLELEAQKQLEQAEQKILHEEEQQANTDPAQSVTETVEDGEISLDSSEPVSKTESEQRYEQQAEAVSTATTSSVKQTGTHQDHD